MEKVGFTTTVPVEVILASGKVPLDLNNVFINSPDPAGMVEQAEAEGLPRTTCGWIKGLYIAARLAGIGRIVAVTQGDCSNTHALMELWQAGGMEIIPFAYPYDRDRDLLGLQIDKMAAALGTTRQKAEEARRELMGVRKKLALVDELTWKDGRVTGEENHRWLVSASDFDGDPGDYGRRLDAFLAEAGGREEGYAKRAVRIGYIGVPPIFTDLYEALGLMGASVVFNETQRQFAMPGDSTDICAQYAAYTYPYDVFGRIEDIKAQAKARGLDGIIHYCQSFCFRAMEDLLIRRGVELPVLTIEGDRPGPVDARTRLRLEGFVEMLSEKKAEKKRAG